MPGPPPKNDGTRRSKGAMPYILAELPSGGAQRSRPGVAAERSRSSRVGRAVETSTSSDVGEDAFRTLRGQVSHDARQYGGCDGSW